MAWRSHGVDNETLVDALKKSSIVTRLETELAMRAVDRGLFVLDRQRAYQDCPLPIGHGVTISAPHMHAYACELLGPWLKPGASVLDVGSGSGYLTAVFAHMVCERDGTGKAIGIEHVPELVDSATKAVGRIDWARDLMRKGQLSFQVGDGRAGLPAQGPFHAIHVGAAAPKLPHALIEQLAPGGAMICPVGPEGGPQEMVLVEKHHDGRVEQRAVMGVIYVPLCDRGHQLSHV